MALYVEAFRFSGQGINDIVFRKVNEGQSPIPIRFEIVMTENLNKVRFIIPSVGLLILTTLFVLPVHAKRPMEYLDRGLVALEIEGGVFLSWRMLGTDKPEIGFNLYRNAMKLNADPIFETTNHVDSNGKSDDKYVVETLLPDGKTEKSEEVAVWSRKAPTNEEARKRRRPGVPFKEIPIPESPEGEYTPGDMSVGDLTGNGRYELVFLWEGTAPYLEAVDLEGKSFWRISCGPNVTYNGMPFLVYDLDGDGKAEVVTVTAPGTKDGKGNFLCKGPAANIDHSKILERKSGRLVEDPAFITVFDGETGEERVTTTFWPPIGPESDLMKTWGDNYGHRAGGIKAAVLYHKELGPLTVYSRGIYTRIAMGAYTFDGRELKRVWTFDSDEESGRYLDYRHMGNHSVAVGDVDGDGSDELMYGACAIDHDGKGLYTTGMGHGDSHALGDLDPDNPGLEFFQGHENKTYGVSMRAAGTGKILWEVRNAADVGRAWAADVDPKYRGAECVSSATPDFDCKGNEIPTKYDAYSQPVYFDGRVQRALRNRNTVNGEGGRILTAWHFGASTVHSTKHDANLVADILGDWREEIIFLRHDKRAFLLFSTWIPTERKNYTLMHDPTYRMNIVVQNVGYNQPAHVGYYFAEGMPVPSIELIPQKNVK